MFPERDCLLSGQQSYTYSRLLYDDLTSFLGSACSSTLRPIQSKSKNDVSLKKSKKQQQQSKSALFPYISIYRDPYLYLYPDRYVPMSDQADLFLYVLATSVSAPKRKVWIFQSYVVRDVTYVRSIRYHSFQCSMIHLRIMSRQFDPFDSYLPSKRGSGAIGRITI